MRTSGDLADTVRATCHSGPAPGQPAAPTTVLADLTRGLWRENPVLVQMLGLCPTLAVTGTVVNSLGMSLATSFVLVSSSVLVSSLRRFIPAEVRITTYVLIIATFVTVADMLMEAWTPDVEAALGPFVFLIVVNCIILGRQEAFASRQPVGRALLDAVGTAAGFTLALILMGTLRELLSAGTLLGQAVFGPRYEPWVIVALPPGGFLTLGGMLLGINWWTQRRAARAEAAAMRHQPFERVA